MQIPSHTLNPSRSLTPAQRAEYAAAKAAIEEIDAEMQTLKGLDGAPSDGIADLGTVSDRSYLGAQHRDYPDKRSIFQFDTEDGSPEKFLQVRDEGTREQPERRILEFESPNAEFAGDSDRYRVTRPWVKGPGSNQTLQIDRSSGTITIIDHLEDNGNLPSMFDVTARNLGLI